MTKILGLNAAMNHIEDMEILDKTHRGMNPAFSLAMADNFSDIPLVNAFARKHKGTKFIGRVYHDLEGGFHLPPESDEDKKQGKKWTVDPLSYANEVKKFDPDIYAHIMNEPLGKFSDAAGAKNLDLLVEWYGLFLDEVTKPANKRKCIIYNWGDRLPQIINGMWDERWWGQLKRMSIYGDQFLIGMHFYGPDELTLHLKAYVETCKHLKIKPIPVVGTEFGMDTHDGSVEDGATARGFAGKKYAKYIKDVIEGELAPFIASGVLVGLCLFTWSTNGKWKNFNITRDTELHEALMAVEYVIKPVAPVVPTPPAPVVKPFPSNFALRSIERKVKSKSVASQFIRSAPNRISSDKIGLITHDGQRCDVILARALREDELVKETIDGVEGVWIPIKANTTQGFIWDGNLIIEVIPDRTSTGEIPVVTVPNNPAPKVEAGLFQWTLTFLGTPEDNAKAIEGLKTLMKGIVTVDSVPVKPP